MGVFRISVLTLPVAVWGEAGRMADLLCGGDVDFVHIRKPDWGAGQLERLVVEVPQELRGRLTLHDHFDLALKYGLGGVHLNVRNACVPVGWRGRVSRSCHSLAEVMGCKGDCDYVSLSPVFDSISKRGYRAAFSRSEIEAARAEGIIDGRVYALGGVRFEDIDLVKDMGFGGALILGDAWRGV